MANTQASSFVQSLKQLARQRQQVNSVGMTLATEYHENPALSGMANADTGSANISATDAAFFIYIEQFTANLYQCNTAAGLAALCTQLEATLATMFKANPPLSVGAIVSRLSRG